MTAQNNKPGLFVVDGSNIATEGRSKPSLEQLNEAVAAFEQEYPDVRVTVVVDATFGHRIAKKEVKAFDEAVANNELVTPPAGAVGRGDAFILAIAHKAGAGVVSNDSFQEFHGDYEWLFDSGRLIGGKPVPHVGWVFVDRNPVRGPKSRESIRAAKQTDDDEAPTAAKERAKRRVRKKQAAATEAAPATDEVSESRDEPAVPVSGVTTQAAAADTSKSKHVNDLMPFIEFVERHAVGQTISATIDSYSSHGAYARAGDVQVYIPLRLMADPAPSSARKVLKIGDDVELVVAAYAPGRRSIDAALPAMASTIEPAAEPAVVMAAATGEAPSKRRSSRRRSKRSAETPAPSTTQPADAEFADAEPAAAEPPAKKAPAKKAPAKKAPAKKAPAKKAPAKKAPAKKAPAKKAPAKKAPAKKAPAKKAPAKKAPAKKAPANQRASKQRAARPSGSNEA